MLEGYQNIGDHAVNSATVGVIALMPGNADPFCFSTFVTDDSVTIISEDEAAIFARGTKVITAVR